MLAMAPFAQAAGREALGEAKGHLQNLEELQRQTVSFASAGSQS